MTDDQMTAFAEKWAENVREVLKPIDFEGLVESGVLEKKGAWYKILKYKEIPKHVFTHVSEFKQTTKNGVVTESFIKFRKLNKSLEQSLKRSLDAYDARKQA